jgi:hypothetical protein
VRSVLPLEGGQRLLTLSEAPGQTGGVLRVWSLPERALVRTSELQPWSVRARLNEPAGLVAVETLAGQVQVWSTR